MTQVVSFLLVVSMISHYIGSVCVQYMMSCQSTYDTQKGAKAA